MATVTQMIKKLEQGELDSSFEKLYGAGQETLENQRARYSSALQTFGELFGSEKEISLYSTPGRTEIGGNHTDHNGGVALAAAVSLDVIAVAAPNRDGIIRVRSKGYAETIFINLENLNPHDTERGRSPSLIRGVAAAIQKAGGRVQGFDAYTSSRILKGSGLSSSAAFEVLIATILNDLFNQNKFSPEEKARMGQFAENEYYGKACGLLDQLACSCGGMLKVDFENLEQPKVSQFELNPARFGYVLAITDTKSTHGNVLAEYSKIREEMETVARAMGKERLQQIKPEEFLRQLPCLREKLSDRCLLRAKHFYAECRRVETMCAALSSQNWQLFLEQVCASGHSSFEYNQNAYLPGERQEIPLALALSQCVLEGCGAWRLHGGGFAGTVQAYVPMDKLTEYVACMEHVFGKGSCYVMQIRQLPAMRVYPVM